MVGFDLGTTGARDFVSRILLCYPGALDYTTGPRITTTTKSIRAHSSVSCWFKLRVQWVLPPVAVLVFYPAGGGGQMVRIGREGVITDAAPMALRYYDDGVAAHDLKLAKLALLCGVKWKSHPKYGCQQLVPKLPPLQLCVCRCLVCQVDSMTSVSSTPSVQLCGKTRGHRSQHVCYDCSTSVITRVGTAVERR